MQFCNRCLYPSNHPYGMIFDSDGICMGCRVHEEKDKINWNKKLTKLKKIIKDFKKNKIDKKNFDCIIPVTGGGDSYYTVYLVKNILELNPLLVSYNSHYNTKLGIRNLANLATKFDCDLLMSTTSPEIHKKITKITFSKFGNMYWHVLAGNLTFPSQIAVRYKIPLIIWGVNGWSEQVGMFSHHDEVEMTERCRLEHALFGLSLKKLIKVSNNTLNYRELSPFIYPRDEEIRNTGLRGIYLSNYFRWDSKKQHEKMINEYSYETNTQQRTFNNYEDVHCFHSAGIHDYLKYLKFGFGKITDHTSREIRLKRLSREQGINLVNKYNNITDLEDTEVFINWLNIDMKEFIDVCDRFRNKSIWVNKNNEWILRDSINNYTNNENTEIAKLEQLEECNFMISNKILDESEKNYTLMGRTYLNKLNQGAIKDKL